jgi:hypothetical protein
MTLETIDGQRSVALADWNSDSHHPAALDFRLSPLLNAQVMLHQAGSESCRPLDLNEGALAISGSADTGNFRRR